MAEPKLWLVTRSEVTQFLVRADSQTEAENKVRPMMMAAGETRVLQHDYTFNMETKRVSLWHGEVH